MKALQRWTALLLSVAMVVSLVAGGMLIRTVADTAMQWYNASLDDLSRFYETGNARSPGMITTVDGDAGGKSYGMYMFASKAGTPHSFAEWCIENYPDGSTGHDIGERLDESYHYISDGYGAYFDAEWESVAAIYGNAFASAQYDYTKAAIYEKVVSLVEKDVPSFDIDNYSVALKNVFWSRGVQHGASDACYIIKRAFNTLGGFAYQPEAELIQAIYAESGRTVTPSELSAENGRTGPTMSGDTANKYGTSGLILRYFFGCSGDVQMGVYRRLAVNEPSDALVMLMNNGGYDYAPVADGSYLLLNGGNQSFALDGTGGILDLDPASSSTTFTLNYYAGGFYTINLTVEGKTQRLSAEGGTPKLASPSASAAQLWELTQQGSGFVLKNRSSGAYLSVSDSKLVMTADAATAWNLQSVTASPSNWSTSGLIYPDKDTILIAGRSSFPVRGVVSCSSAITSLNISILSGNSAVINKSVSPNAPSYDLKKLDDSIAYSKLSAGDYTFVLTAAAAGTGKTVELARSSFTVKPNDGLSVSDESFLVTFDAQGGTLKGNSTKRVTLDDIVYGELPTASRRDAEFLGWFTADGEEIVASSLIRAADLTLYARYAGVHTYTFLDASGGRFYSGTAAAGELIPAPAVSPTKAPDDANAYVFKGWKDYTPGITVMGDEDVSFAPVYSPVKLSEVTSPEGSYWPGLTPGTTVAQLGSGVTVYRDGLELVSEATLATGMTATFGSSSYTLVITGDANGDGKITITDVVALQAHVVGKQTLEGAYAKAADLNGDGKVTITDVVKAARVVVGKDTIS